MVFLSLPNKTLYSELHQHYNDPTRVVLCNNTYEGQQGNRRDAKTITLLLHTVPIFAQVLHH
jgi:hypothetical protein